ncbi:MAG: porphobilinogen synthase [bacterium]
MFYPSYRPRRMRKNPQFRRMVRETALSVDNLIYPMFVIHGKNVRKEISSMPGNFQLSVDNLVKDARAVHGLGIPAVILFGIPKTKDEMGTGAYDDKGIIQTAVRALKDKVPDLMVITDVCLCEYTSHGHCGIVENGEILNDPTLELLAREAVSHARAGADMVAPSDMMDGRVGAIRDALDEEGLDQIPIMSYAVKYASAFYGPFRDAAESPPKFGDRSSYQMDPANTREAMREAELDVAEGADILMVKPALPYLDIIHRVRDEFDLPVAAYNVSGEYSMIKAAARLGWLDEKKAMMESLTAIKRAGADLILTYWAREAAKLLHE